MQINENLFNNIDKSNLKNEPEQLLLLLAMIQKNNLTNFKEDLISIQKNNLVSFKKDLISSAFDFLKYKGNISHSDPGQVDLPTGPVPVRPESASRAFFKPAPEIYKCVNEYFLTADEPSFRKAINKYLHSNKLAPEDMSRLKARLELFTKTIIDIKTNKNGQIDLDTLSSFLPPDKLKDILSKAILLGSVKPEQLSIVPSSSGHLTILTEVSWGTLGDYHAAARLIRLLTSASPELNIHWVIRGQIDEIPDELETTTKLSITKIIIWDLLFNDIMLQRVKDTTAFLVFPTFHFLTSNNLDDLRKIAPVISCLEYSYPSKQDLKTVELRTGLGKDEMGIFIFPPQGQHPLTQIDRQQPIIDVLFSRDSTTNNPIAPLTQEQTIQYDETHALYFGYANKEVNRVHNRCANVSNFLQIVLASAPEGKDIDVVLPITREQLNDTNINFSQYSAVSFVSQKDSEVSQTLMYANPTEPQLPKLRVINLFRFDNNTFTQLVAASQPFKLCTGDQSLSDVVSVGSAVVFYQTMDWKKSLAYQYLDCAKAALDSAGIKNSLALRYLELTLNDKAFAIKEVSELVKEPKLVEEFKLIHRYIFENRNLNTTLPERITAFLQYMTQEKALFSSNVSDFEMQGSFTPGTSHQ